MEEQLRSHPLVGTSLSHHDVLYALSHLQCKTNDHCDRQRLIAVLLVLYVGEVLENGQHHILGMGKRAFWNRLQAVVHLHSTTCRFRMADLVLAVTEVDTTSTTTRLLQSRDPGASLLVDVLRSSPYLADLHRRLTQPAGATEEPAPYASWLARLIINGLMMFAIPVTFIIHEGRADGQPFFRVSAVHQNVVLLILVFIVTLLLWYLGARRSLTSWFRSRTLMHGTIVYTLLLISVDSARPAAEVELQASERFARHPQLLEVLYSFLGALLSDQIATYESEDKFDLLTALCFPAALMARCCQLSLSSDTRSSKLFWLCARYQMSPFAVGFIVLQPFALITPRLWRELRKARRQTDAANVEVAMVRSHAWAVEAARREQLTYAHTHTSTYTHTRREQQLTSAAAHVGAGGHLPFLAESRDLSSALKLLREMRLKHGDMAHTSASSLLVQQFICIRELIFIVPSVVLITARHADVGLTLGLGRVAFANFAISIALCSLASIFPSDFASTAAQRYLLSLVFAMAAVGTVVSLRFCADSLSTAAAAAQGSTALTVVHIAASTGHLLFSTASVVSYMNGQYSWWHTRAFLAADGLVLGATALALWALGHDSAAPLFPPGGVPLSSACMRSLCTLCWALMLTQRNRQCIQAFAKAAGIEPPSVIFTRASSGVAKRADGMRKVVRTAVAGGGGAVPESSIRIQPGAPSGLAPSIQQLMHSQLEARFRYGQLLCVALPALYFIFWQFNHDAPHGSLPVGPVLFFSGFLSLGCLLCVSAFPCELESREGRLFLLPATVACALVAAVEAYRSFFGYGTVSHVNLMCKLAHALHCITINVNWSALMLQVARCRGSWKVVRQVLLVDGLIVCTSAITMRLLGPPRVYQPRNISFAEALERGMITPALSALLLPANRDRIAAFANSLGLKHVTVTLDEIDEMQHPRSVRSVQHTQQPQPADTRKVAAEAGGQCAAALERASLSSKLSMSNDPPQLIRPQPSRLNPLMNQPAGGCADGQWPRQDTAQQTAEHEAAAPAAAATALDELARARVAAHPLTGSALCADDVHWISVQLQLREQHGRHLWLGHDPLRLAAVLLVLFAEECLMHQHPSALGLTADESYGLLQDLVQSYAISQNDLMEAVARVDTEGSATHLVHSHAISAVGLWDGTGNGASDHPGRWSPDHGGALLPESPTVPSTEQTMGGGLETTPPPLAVWYRMQAVQLALAVVIFAAFTRMLADDTKQYALFVVCAFVFVTLASLSSGLLPTRSWLAPLSVRLIRISPPFTGLFSAYTVCLMLYSSTLPSHVVAAQARSRLSLYWLHSLIVYFALGCAASMQPTATRRQCVGKASSIILFVLRGVQISAADAQPLDMLHLGSKAAAIPFVLGYLFMGQQEVLMRMWLEIRAARCEARTTSARMAAERQHAQSLEMARRVMLVARKSSSGARARRRHREKLSTQKSNSSTARSNSDEMWPIDGVVQEEGYQSPGRVDEEELEHEKED